jgi:membrane protein CcdC involved in cytochrome C biogenesis
MHFDPSHVTPLEYAVASAVGAVVIILWRIREGRTAVTLKKIIAPPMGMATGLAYPLLLTSRLRRDGDTIMMKRSSMFLIVIIVLAAVRFFARGYFDKLLTVEQTGALFFILAFGMILRWRVNMLRQYRSLTTQHFPPAAAVSQQ